MTTRILLEPGNAVLPTSNPATLTKVTSGGAAPSNAPVLTLNVLEFSDSTDQAAMWAFRLPDDWISGGTITLLWSHTAATSGNVAWKAGAELLGPLTAAFSSAAYNAADAATAVSVPGTVGMHRETSIGLTMTGAAAGALCALFVGRDADAGTDTATGGVARLLAAQFSYTS
jgi:hypothetical protein